MITYNNISVDIDRYTVVGYYNLLIKTPTIESEGVYECDTGDERISVGLTVSGKIAQSSRPSNNFAIIHNWSHSDTMWWMESIRKWSIETRLVDYQQCNKSCENICTRVKTTVFSHWIIYFIIIIINNCLIKKLLKPKCSLSLITSYGVQSHSFYLISIELFLKYLLSL